MFSADAAARYIDEAHRTRARYRNLPEAIAPQTVVEAYAAQAALCGLWGARLGPVAGLKIATTTRVMQQLMGIDHPCMGTIFAARVHASPATIAKADFVNVRIECELARPARPRPAQDGGALCARERACSGSGGHAGVRADRGPVRRLQGHQGAVADRRQCLERRHRAWAATPLPAGRDLDGIAGTLLSDGKEIAAGRTDDPLGALAWLANQAAECGRPLTAGMVVITGSVIPTVDIAPGERLDFSLDSLGAVMLAALA